MPSTPNICPCQNTQYVNCCGVYHAGKYPENAEKLMRSRYSAYVLELEDYLLKTWHDSTRPTEALFDGQKTQWLELKVKSFTESADQQSATVEFVAIYKINGKAHRLHEISRFVREGDQWFYVDGQFPEIK
jgi:SEC-C motif-containing protein